MLFPKVGEGKFLSGKKTPLGRSLGGLGLEGFVDLIYFLGRRRPRTNNGIVATTSPIAIVRSFAPEFTRGAIAQPALGSLTA